MSEEDRRAKRHRHPVLAGVLKAAAVVLVLMVAAFSLRGKLPSISEVGRVLGDADTTWLAVAVVAEVVSMAMFARQQRRLLFAFGVRMPRHRALALAYSRSAIAISLPAGSAISAAYAFRQFRTDGASKRTAATVMVLSGLLSFAALGLLYATGALAAGAVHLGTAWQEKPGTVSFAVAMSTALIAFVGMLAWISTGPVRPLRPRSHRPLAARWPRLAPLADALTSSREVDGRQWTLALGAAVANWLTDLLCLYAAARAFALPVGLVEIGAVYLTVQVVRQVPLTPGGIGVIEVSLLAGLLSAGAGEAAAAATVLVYRVLSCWLIIPVGLLCWLVLRRPSPHHAVEDEPELFGEVGGGALVAGQVPEQRVLEHAVHQGVGQVGRRREL
jgi:uncharacterized membrane protein YbhN (UPF0104 family)